MTQSKWFKLATVLLVAAFALACLAGCSNKPTSEPTTAPTQAPAANNEGGDDNKEPAPAKDPSEFTGDLMYWSGDQNWSDAMDAAFMAVYPNVNVTYTPLGWGDYLQKLQTSMASGLEIPDIICCEVGWRMRVYGMNISENLEAEPYNLDRNDMFEYLWPRCSNKEGQIVGLEMQITPSGLGYRSDIAEQVWGEGEGTREAMEKRFKDAGDNYDAYTTIGKEIVEKTNGKTKMFAGTGDAWCLVFFQNSAKGLVNEDGSINFEGVVKPSLEVVKKWHEAGILGTIDQWTPQWEASYALGETFAYPWTTWTTEGVRNDRDPDGAGHWGLMIPPYGAFSWGGTTMGVYNEGKNKEATWEFVRWTNWELDGAKAAADKRDYQLSRKSNYEADPSLKTKQDDYYGIDLFAFWAECADEAIAVTPTIYDQIVGDAVGVALTQLQANPSMTLDEMCEVVKTEIKNKDATVEIK